MRGAHFTPARAASEWVLARAYRGGWPARLVRRLGLQPDVETCRHVVECARWPAEAPELRLAFASDLHAGPTTHPSLLATTCRKLQDAAPDVLLLGGDYVYLHAYYIDELVPLLAKVEAPFGRFAVLGNHDVWAEESRVRSGLERAGFRVLTNEAAALAPPFDHVSICGLDEPWVGEPDRARTFENARAVKVLLMHAPEGLLVVGDEDFDLAVCGHTHGGHIALPGGFPIVVPGPLSRRYCHGQYDVEGRPLIVSRGIGATESALRLFANPDIRVITMRKRAPS